MRSKQKKLKDRSCLETYALWLLGQRDMTRRSVRDKVLAYAEDRSDVEPLLDRLEELGYLDDRRFAENYVRSCRESRGYGPVKTRAKLMEKGISGGLIEEFLDPSNPDWVAKAAETRLRKFGEPPKEFDERERQMRFLAAKGYTFDQIKASFKLDLD